ncbi:MAG: undecaprenyl-diphosphate phosphatase [Thermodesulfobacteriota bacterium]|nr:undecaprenyl-diphosphate phosphatase [Thermodesulfobacteriota bacterium]
MEPLQAIFLGIIQGLTEFLPVSSSGHLVLFQNLLGFKEPELLLDISLHVGTLIAVCIVFFHEIKTISITLIRLPGLAKAAGGYKPLYARNEQVRMTALIVMGTLPTALLGILFHQVADQIFGAVWIVGIMLMVTGLLLWVTRYSSPTGRPIGRVTAKDALVIGLTQGLAILPGISRSGSTISVALFMGVDREVAGRYSFLLSIPAILGALIVGMDSSIGHTSISIKVIVTGTVSAAVIGYISLKLLLKIVKRGKLYYFAPYCWIVGATALMWNFL